MSAHGPASRSSQRAGPGQSSASVDDRAHEEPAAAALPEDSTVQQSGADASADSGDPGRWSDLPFPWEPPFTKKLKTAFEDDYHKQLVTYESTFFKHFNGTIEERKAAESRARQTYPHVAALNAWHAAWTKSLEDLNWPIVAATFLAAVVAPWLVTEKGIFFTIASTLGGFVGMLIVVVVIWAAASVFDSVDRPLGHLTMLVLCSGAVAWTYAKQPPIGAVIVTTAAGIGTLVASFLLTSFLEGTSKAIVNRIKVSRYLDAELSISMLNVIDCLTAGPENYAGIARYCDYASVLLERDWRRSCTLGLSAPVQFSLSERIKAISAGMRELGLKASFSTRNPLDSLSFDSALMKTMEDQLTAMMTFRYGDLFHAEDEAVVVSRLKRFAHVVRTAVAGFAPIVALFVLPRLFPGHPIPDSLFGTFLLVSLGWLALYVVSWLDPNANVKVSALSGVADIFNRSKP
jgi:hypothetical protein